MKIIFKTAALAVMALLLCLLPACSSNASGENTTAADTTVVPVTEAPPTPLVLAEGGKSEYVIVRPDEAEQALIDAVSGLYVAFSNAGIQVDITTDWERKGTDPSTRPKKEILVGATNREETAQVQEKLRYDEYSVEVVDDKLVIVGGNDVATIAACNAFVDKYLSTQAADLTLAREQLLSLQVDYPVTKLTIGGHDIAEYTIAYTADIYQSAAEALQKGIINACGNVLKIAHIDTVSGMKLIVGMPADQAAIAPCTGDKVFSLAEDSFFHAIEQKDGTLVLAGHSEWTAGDAVYTFLAEYLTEKTGEVAVGEISLSGEMSAAVPLYGEADLRIMTYNVLGVAENHLERYPYVIAQIRRYLPDILGMQEAPKTVHSKVIDAVGDVYAEVHKWHKGGEIVNYTPILYRKDKYKVLEADCVFLRSRYTGTNTKSITWAVFETIETGERFIVTNLHGSLIVSSYNISGSNSVEGAAWRVDNVKQMVEKLDELKAKYGDLPTLSVGDFNFNQDAQAYKEAVAAGLTSAETCATVSRVTGTKTTHSVGKAPAAGKSIDHIFVNDKVSVYVHNIVMDADALKGSDHCAVYADVKLSK